jgi:hypothetical protein
MWAEFTSKLLLVGRWGHSSTIFHVWYQVGIFTMFYMYIQSLQYFDGILLDLCYTSSKNSLSSEVSLGEKSCARH